MAGAVNYPTGWIPDRPDPRDLPAFELLGSGPAPMASDNSHLVKVFDQGGYSSCVGNATAQAVGASIRWTQTPSRLAIYYYARRRAGLHLVDRGCYIRDAFKVLGTHGWAPESMWPYSRPAAGNGSKPDFFTLMKSAERWRGQYRRIWEDGGARIDAVKRALASGRLVVFGTDVGPTFMGGDTMRPANDARSGHAMTLHGHGGDAFRVVNSWGRSWGDGGHCTMHADYIEWISTRDLWVIDTAGAT